MTRPRLSEAAVQRLIRDDLAAVGIDSIAIPKVLTPLKVRP